MKSTISYKRQLTIWRKALGLISLALCVVLLFIDFRGSILLLAFGLGALQQDGLDINLLDKQYRTTYGFLNIRFGSWKPLPEIEYVSVFKTAEKTRVWISSASTLTKDVVYVVNLFYNRNKRLEAYRTYDKKDAFDTALHFADALYLDILDATISDSEWIDNDILRTKGEIIYKS